MLFLFHLGGFFPYPWLELKTGRLVRTRFNLRHVSRWLQIFFSCPPLIGENIPRLTNIFSNGLKPPTSCFVFRVELIVVGFNLMKVEENSRLGVCLFEGVVLFMFKEIWGVPKMAVPPKHTKMIIFSRKTHGCWVPTF